MKFFIIDTPGFGDCRGFDRDEKNLKMILDCIEEEEYINCVCIVINGRQARITASFGRIFVVFTNSNDDYDLTFDPEELKTYFGEKVDTTAYIENPLCRFEKAIEREKKGKPKKEQNVKSVKKSFNEAREALKEMCRKIKKFERVYTQNCTRKSKQLKQVFWICFQLTIIKKS